MDSSLVRYWEKPDTQPSWIGIAIGAGLIIIIAVAMIMWLRRTKSLSDRLRITAGRLQLVFEETICDDQMMQWTLKGLYRGRPVNVTYNQYSGDQYFRDVTEIIYTLNKCPSMPDKHNTWSKDPIIAAAIAAAVQNDQSFRIEAGMLTYSIKRLEVDTLPLRRHLDIMADTADTIENALQYPSDKT